MESCEYKQIDTSPGVENGGKTSWKPFLRQFIVCSGVWTVYFAIGMGLGAPTVLIPQLRREANSTDAVSEEMASWLYSIFGYASVPWIIILATLIHYFGRKPTFILVSLNTILMFVFFFFSETATHLLISEAIQGMTHANSLTVSIVIIAEYTSPRYRGLFLTLKTASIFWGVWVSNAIGTFLHWKFIPMFGFFCSLYSLTVFYWCESPHWLASTGRFNDCRVAHRWLKGSDYTSERELENLIDSQIEYNQNKIKSKFSFFKTCALKEFYKPVLISMLMVVQFQLSGKFVCSVYSIEIIKKISSNEASAYTGMLILDGVTVFSMYFGCFLTKVLRRRTLLFTTSSVAIIFLFILSGYLYLINLDLIVESDVFTIIFLVVFSMAISSGPVIMMMSIYAELTPLRYKSSCMIIIALLFQISQSTMVKLSPYIFRTFDMHGTFLLFGISVTICSIFLYKYLPETKDRTLQEIEEYFKDK